MKFLSLLFLGILFAGCDTTDYIFDKDFYTQKDTSKYIYSMLKENKEVYKDLTYLSSFTMNNDKIYYTFSPEFNSGFRKSVAYKVPKECKIIHIEANHRDYEYSWISLEKELIFENGKEAASKIAKRCIEDGLLALKKAIPEEFKRKEILNQKIDCCK